MRLSCLLLVFGCILIGTVVASYGQNRRDSVRVSPRSSALDSLKRPSLLRDTTAQGAQTDSLRKQSREIETSVTYSAQDSIILDVNGKIARLYGQAKINYGDIALDAEYIEINWETGIVEAQGVKDSTGKVVGAPVFTEGSQKYETENIQYNIKTKKAIISGVITQQGEGYVRGTDVFKDPYDNLYIKGAIYTTCNLPNPHFHIAARKIKVVGNKQVVSGPFNFYLNGIPLPLGLPFGFFPYSSEKRKSGVIVPTYGEEPTNRGFFLRQGGYYWAMSDYMDMSFLGEVYSRGGWGLNVRSAYTKKYAYSGSLDLRFNRQSTGDEGFKSRTDAFWISWSHSPVSKGTGRFSASVNLGSTNYNSKFAYAGAGVQNDINRRISSSFTSSISYSNSFSIKNLPVTYSASARQDMNTVTGIVNTSLPEFNISLNRFYPLKGKSGSSSKYFWQTLNMAYQLDGYNRISNSPQSFATSYQGLPISNAYQTNGDTLPFNFSNAGLLWKRADKGVTHTIPVSMTMKLLKYLSMNYSFNYKETWYPQKLTFYDAQNRLINSDLSFNQGDSIRIDTARGFARSSSYSASASLTTNIYGMFNVHGKRIEAIRHRMVPSIGFSFTPDLSPDKFGFYQIAMVQDSSGEMTKVRLPRFSSTSNLPSASLSKSITFSLSNTLEAKIKAKSDTAKVKYEKVSLLDNFGFSGSYNLAADSLKLSNISISARTKLFKKVDINFTSTLDPYRMVQLQSVDADNNPVFDSNGNPVYIQRRVDEFAWRSSRYTSNTGRVGKVQGSSLGRITSLNLSISTSLNPNASKKTTEKVDKDPTLDEQTKQQIKANPNLYVDFDIPWNANVAYNFNYSKDGFRASSVVQTLTFNGEVKLTEKWRIGVTSGYDFTRNYVVNTTAINIFRDLHCWQMTANWAPFGSYQYYSIDIQVKASMLKDLKLSRRRTWYDQGR
ncbi:putative LPS assembly protein LptD [Cytophagaceae bacterium DM2B3-1]|uniref:LPS assembly protein LptD n=1 Tax=Xanthocytophaga flava TaxID=3048013 RepID=A0ABT7CX58_9BACT|nr:putative LPS assembly protein LptD [Xanthocytophaga flavus]MDJ1498359.1 putative LPS assembly protein LptD [Xanthocytophaga flavus]